MKISIKGFIYHKSAERYVDCFDRYGINEKTNKFAISDGVSKSFFPDVWAELLVEFFLKNEGRINLTDTDSYKSIQNEWRKRVGEIVNKPDQKYFVRNFFIQGRPAAATFVGLHFFKEDSSLKWEVVALGDSFLFFVPENLESITNDFDKVIWHSSKNNFEFNNFPDFFDSRSITHKGKIRKRQFNLKCGTFYLMTDALAEWFISEKQKAVEIISQWTSQQDFENSIRKLRKTSLYNDDAAILILHAVEDNSQEINYSNIQVTNFRELIESEKKEEEHESLPSRLDEIEKESLTQEQVINNPLENKENSDYEDVNLNNPKEEINVPTAIQERDNKTIDVERDNKNPKPRKIRLWEIFTYPFWIYWGPKNNILENEVGENEKDELEINTNESKDIIDEIDKHNNDEIKEEKKDSKKPINPDEDISSITDKF